MLGLLLCLVAPGLAGWLLVQRAWPSRRPVWRHALLKGTLALGWAVGASSCSFFAALVLGAATRSTLLVAETAFFLGMAILVAWAGRRTADMLPDEVGTVTRPRYWLRGLLFVLFLAALASAAAKLTSGWLRQQHGEWDARAIWNLRARFLYRGQDHWTDGFSSLLQHTDYPLLLPASVARGWHYLGFETTVLPGLLALAFTLATVGLLSSAIACLRGTSQGILAGLVLLGTPFFIQLGTWQYADIPLSFYILATLVLVCLHDGSPGARPALLTLAGSMAGFAAWTKNEGMLFLGSVVLARVATVAPGSGWKVLAREGRAFALGLAPVALVVLYFKGRFAGANDLIAGQGLLDIIGKLGDGARYAQVGQALVQQRAIEPLLLLPLVLYFILLGRARVPRLRSGVLLCLFVLGLMLLGYAMVYLVSPHDLTWHLKTSLRRLLMQIWPTAIFTFFLFTATPEEALAWKAALAAPPRLAD